MDYTIEIYFRAIFLVYLNKVCTVYYNTPLIQSLKWYESLNLLYSPFWLFMSYDSLDLVLDIYVHVIYLEL